MAVTMQSAAAVYTSLTTMRHAAGISATESEMSLFLTKWKKLLRNQVIGYNGLLSAPTTTSTQAAGTGATLWNVNVSAMMAIVNGTVGEVAAAADTAIHSTTMLNATAAECIASICLYVTGAGVLTLTAVKGTSALTSVGATAPTDAVVTAQIGTFSWIRFGNTKLVRSATTGTTVVQTYDNTQRPLFGVTTDDTFWGTVS
jgi:hypothetical protein